MNDQDTQFKGPVFVVGMPRSGTKLIRDLLNNHSEIAITPNESYFIPYYYKHIHKFGDLRERENFKTFYDEFSNATFFERLTSQFDFITMDSWYDAVEDWSYAGVVEAFYKEFASFQGKSIWGDKTPHYLIIVSTIKELFPDAKIIHIIRDARDYCLSLKKWWMKNMYRSAQKWNDQISKCRNDARGINPDDYLEVTYENLIDEPEALLQRLCAFLDIQYEEGMVKLKKATDIGGDAGGYVGIMKKNYRKWQTELSGSQIQRIEEICGELLRDLGYDVAYKGNTRRLSKLEGRVYKIQDGVGLMRHEVRYNGLKGGVMNVIKGYKFVKDREADQQ